MKKTACLWMLLLLVVGMPVLGQELYRGEVNVRTEAERVIVSSDLNADGVSDHEFTLHTAGSPTQQVTYRFPDAQVLYVNGGVYITSMNDPTTIALTVEGADSPASSNDTVRMSGIGVSHSIRSSGLRDRSLKTLGIRSGGPYTNDPSPGTGSASCSAGGPGAASCSVSVGISCSVTCSTGYYACCDGASGCKCVKNP